VQTDLISQERLKTMLVAADPNFYLVAAKTPGATYKVLWYRLDPDSRLKIDILRPGIMNIPCVPPELIGRVSGLPVMPLSGILLLKLQAWEDHRNAEKWHMRDKAQVDYADLARLLPIAIREGLYLPDETWLPENFIEAARSRVERLLMLNEDMYCQWQEIGLLERQGTCIAF
jgi:hypothetical protein